MQSNPRRLESSTLTTLPTSSQGRGPTWPNRCRNICSVHLAWKFADSGSHVCVVYSNMLFIYFSCIWNILDTSHASEMFRMFLIQVEYFGYFLCEWNIFDTFHAIEISLKYAVDCSWHTGSHHGKNFRSMENLQNWKVDDARGGK